MRKFALIHSAVSPYIIDCGAKPFEQRGLSVLWHYGEGKLEWNQDQCELYRAPVQIRKRCIDGLLLHDQLIGMQHTHMLLDANVLDFLLAHPSLIPYGFPGNEVCFWGTGYTDRYQQPHVRCLIMDSERHTWRSGCYCIRNDFFSYQPAALYPKSA